MNITEIIEEYNGIIIWHTVFWVTVVVLTFILRVSNYIKNKKKSEKN